MLIVKEAALFSLLGLIGVRSPALLDRPQHTSCSGHCLVLHDCAR